jgi:hypothetical protein
MQAIYANYLANGAHAVAAGLSRAAASSPRLALPGGQPAVLVCEIKPLATSSAPRAAWIARTNHREPPREGSGGPNTSRKRPLAS